MQKNKGKFQVETITFTALLVALQVVLGNVLQIPLMEKQYNFGFLPIAIAGALLGAPAAMIVGGLGDFLGAHLFPQGAYFPGFTLTNVLVGLVCGLVLDTVAKKHRQLFEINLNMLNLLKGKEMK